MAEETPYRSLEERAEYETASPLDPEYWEKDEIERRLKRDEISRQAGELSVDQVSGKSEMKF